MNKKNRETMLYKNCIAPVFNDEYASNDATITFGNKRILQVIPPMFSYRNDFSEPSRIILFE
jgi:hypothetical protein